MNTSRPALRAFVVYTGGRLLLFALVLGVALLLGFGGFVVVIGAFLVSGAVSYLLLGRQRTAFGRVIEESRARRAAVDRGADG